jgi:hypothetical protein
MTLPGWFVVALCAFQAARTSKPPTEEQACASVAAELATLARYAATEGDVNDAHDIYAAAAAFAPRDDSLKAELAKLRGKKQLPTKRALEVVAERRKRLLAKAAGLLAPVADSLARDSRSDDLARLVTLMSVHHVPVEAIVAAHDLVWFEPYCDWRSKVDVERLKAGWDVVDGSWRDPETVAKLDGSHKQWIDPWCVRDEFTEVKTTLPFRTARTALATVSSFRDLVLETFAGEMDLRPPGPRMTVELTASVDEMTARVHEIEPHAGDLRGAAALFVDRGSSADPCIARTMTHVALLHEVTHQILHLYSRHAVAGTSVASNPWLDEGLAMFFPYYALVDGAWILKRPKKLRFEDGVLVDSCFGWCHDHADEIPAIRDFVAIDPARFPRPENYAAACGLVAFLLEGRERAWRGAFSRLAELVYQGKAEKGSFEECFKGVDLNDLDRSFRTWCRGLKLDEE